MTLESGKGFNGSGIELLRLASAIQHPFHKVQPLFELHYLGRPGPASLV
jgi:hypothetical protein